MDPCFFLSIHIFLWGGIAWNLVDEHQPVDQSVWVFTLALIIGKLKSALMVFLSIHFAFWDFLSVAWEMSLNKSTVSLLVRKL